MRTKQETVEEIKLMVERLNDLFSEAFFHKVEVDLETIVVNYTHVDKYSFGQLQVQVTLREVL
jgi:hypothetical protein